MLSINRLFAILFDMKNLVLLAFLGVLTGCHSVGGDFASRPAVLDANGINADIFQLKSRVQDLEATNKMLLSERDSLQAGNAAKLRAVEDALEGIRQDLLRAASANDKMKAEIVSEMSKKIAALMRQTAPARSGGEVGRYHIVASGDTLSAIAAAYGKTMNAIVKANGMKDVNSIRVGQKLFIPE